MQQQPDQCLTKAELSEFLLAEGQCGSAIEAHLSQCADCQRRLEHVTAANELWFETRDHLAGASLTDKTAPPDLETISQDYLKSILGPTDDPKMLGRIGLYEVLSVIGCGGTGMVLKALDTRLNRFVAIKILAPTFSTSGSARKRFEREGRAIAAVSHDHVVAVHNVDEYRGLPYIVMQYIAGRSLQQRVDNDGPLATQEVVRISMQIADALSCAHEQGIIHRDVKPSNILLENGVERVRVSDFGLAQVADDVSMTRSGIIAGTPQYMSPEQSRGEPLDGRSDLFSLGSVMYAMCTGHPPFRAGTTLGVIQRISSTDPRPIRQINSDIPEWLARFVHRLLEKNPADRFDSAREVRNYLSNELAYQQHPASLKVPHRPWMMSTYSSLRWPLIAIGATLLTVAVVLGTFFVVRRPGASTTPQSAANAQRESVSQSAVSETNEGEHPPGSAPATIALQASDPHGDTLGPDRSTSRLSHAPAIKPFPLWRNSASGTVYARAVWNDGSSARTSSDVVRFDPNTGRWQPLIGWATHPCLSHSGKYLSFRGTHPESHLSGTWACDWKGENLWRVSTVAGPMAWQPQGNQLIINDRYFELQDGQWKTPEKLANRVAGGSEPALDSTDSEAGSQERSLWRVSDGHVTDCSSDGTWFLRSWNRFGSASRHRITLSRGIEGERDLLHEGEGTVANVRLSPNAEQAAFILNDGHHASLRLLDRTSKQSRVLHSTASDLSAHPTCFSWSPDSKQILVGLVDWVSEAAGLESRAAPFLAPIPEANARLVIYEIDLEESSPLIVPGIEFLGLESFNWVADPQTK